MVGTWTPPGAIFSFEFDDESLTLKLIHRAEIPKDEPISWMAFNVCPPSPFLGGEGLMELTIGPAFQENNIWRVYEKMV